jgi:hypothetical protein
MCAVGLLVGRTDLVGSGNKKNVGYDVGELEVGPEVGN